MTNKMSKILIIPALLLAFNGYTAEQEAPAADQISISADKQEGQLKANVGIFEKNVEIIHGNRRITADRLEVHKRDDLGDNKQLLIATGSPAYFEEKQVRCKRMTLQCLYDSSVLASHERGRLRKSKEASVSKSLSLQKLSEIKICHVLGVRPLSSSPILRSVFPSYHSAARHLSWL